VPFINILCNPNLSTDPFCVTYQTVLAGNECFMVWLVVYLLLKIDL